MKADSQKNTKNRITIIPSAWKKAAGILKQSRRKNDADLKKIRTL